MQIQQLRTTSVIVRDARENVVPVQNFVRFLNSLPPRIRLLVRARSSRTGVGSCVAGEGGGHGHVVVVVAGEVCWGLGAGVS
jgi:hypothetical protein